MLKQHVRLSPEIQRRLLGAGLDPESLTQEQLDAFESLEKPEKAHWVTKVLAFGSVLFGILALLSLFSAEWLSALAWGLASLILMYAAYRVQVRVAAKRFYQASIRKDIANRLGVREVRVKRITYVPGRYSQLRLLDGSNVFVQTLPQSLKVSRMALRFLPTRKLWEYNLPLEIRTPSRICDTARELLDLVLQSIEHCGTLAQVQQKLQSETTSMLDSYLYGDK